MSCEGLRECVHGDCEDGRICSCHLGWTGRFCDKSRGCDKESCVNGDCLIDRQDFLLILINLEMFRELFKVEIG